MCGIAGVFLKKPDKRIIKKVSKMEKGLSHRGPDSSGFYSNKLIKLIPAQYKIEINENFFFHVKLITLEYFKVIYTRTI